MKSKLMNKEYLIADTTGEIWVKIDFKPDEKLKTGDVVEVDGQLIRQYKLTGDLIIKGFSLKTMKKVTFLKKDVAENGSIYEIYEADSPENARTFLKTKKVEKQYYYIIVETPEGNWGVDKEGMFLEHLEPWQVSLIETADCQGRVLSWGKFGIEMAARGANDNFTCDIECGKCKRRWTDGIRYRNLTAVRCPECKAVNRIDSRNIEVVFIGE
jgi:hypothetical protein